MRVSSVSCNLYQTKSSPVKKRNNTVNRMQTQNGEDLSSPAFKEKSRAYTKILAGISAITAITAIIGTGGAAAVILPALGYVGTCTGIGYALDKDNEEEEKRKKSPKS